MEHVNRSIAKFYSKWDQPHDKIEINNFRKESLETIQSSKLNYMGNLGNQISDPKTSQKMYWSSAKHREFLLQQTHYQL